MDTKIKIEKLKVYFEKRDDVVMAFLFGSQAKGEGRIHAHSDWDIAVYFKSGSMKTEWEEADRDYPADDEVWRDCTDILETDNVDVLVLNRAPSSIAHTAIEGILLTMKYYSLWARFARIISSAAEEYRRFVDEFYAIAQRFSSLSSMDREDLKRTVE